MAFTEHLLKDVACHSLYSFMDGFNGYNQVAIHPADQSKTACHSLGHIHLYKNGLQIMQRPSFLQSSGTKGL